jgi:site-specific recombinase XerD
VQEIVNIKVKDVNLIEASIYIAGSAKNNARTLTLKAKQILLIHEYKKEHSENNYFFEMENKSTLWPGIINRIINPVGY